MNIDFRDIDVSKAFNNVNQHNSLMLNSWIFPIIEKVGAGMFRRLFS